MSRRAVAVFGTGRLAGAIAPALARGGWPVAAICSRDRARARALARRVPGANASNDPAGAARAARVLLLAVPDGAIGDVAARLAEAEAGSWRGRTVLHHAGALGPEPLAPLAHRGASTGVLHPLQALVRSRPATPFPQGTRARVEGSRGAVATARALCRTLGLEPLRLRGTIGRRERLLYHVAASVASNDVVALVAEAAGLLVRLGLSREDAVAALLPLVRGAVDGIARAGIEGALTGPVSRGDAPTIEGHLDALRGGDERLGEVHRLLSERLLEKADLPPGRRREIARILGRGRRRSRGV